MRPELVGEVLNRTRTKAYAARMDELAATLGTESAKDTARLALFFGAPFTRSLETAQKMGMAMDRALLAGHEIQRQFATFVPFKPQYA